MSETHSTAPIATFSGRLSFVEPLLGLGSHTDFVLNLVEGTDDLFTLSVAGSGEGSRPRLFLLDPGAYFLDYDPVIAPDTVAELAGPGEGRAEPDPTDAADADDMAVLVVVHPADATSAPTANLLAPIVVHRATRRARQVVLDGTNWPLRAPLAPA
ncbi:flagellar assembly protein FliW [Actinomycetaceae bacterium L2_0104]